jgi:dTMP kinase
VGLFAYRQMDDHSGVPVLPELWNALRGRRQNRRPRHAGLFVAIEGADATTRASQLEALRSWLIETGREVVVASDAVIAAPLEASLRQLQADPSAALHPRTEALLAAAARAEHVARVIEPALARGAVVLTDHYVDSTIAHQSAASCAGLDELTVLAQWATMSLLPDVTVLLDIETPTGAGADTGAVTAKATADAGADVPGSPAPGSLNGSRPPTFDEEVRAAYLRLADEESHRYLVLDCAAPAGELRARIRQVVARRLGDATLSDIGDPDASTVAAAAGGPELAAVAAGGTGPDRPPGTGRGDEPDWRGGVDRRGPIMDTGAPGSPGSTRFPEGSA